MKKLSKQSEIILVAFCLHEKLFFPKVKEIFLKQTEENQKIQLKDMQKTIKLKYNNSKAYAQFLKSASNQAKNDSIKSPRTKGN